MPQLQARAAKDFALSDQIRIRLADQGILIMDTPQVGGTCPTVHARLCVNTRATYSTHCTPSVHMGTGRLERPHHGHAAGVCYLH